MMLMRSSSREPAASSIDCAGLVARQRTGHWCGGACSAAAASLLLGSAVGAYQPWICQSDKASVSRKANTSPFLDDGTLGYEPVAARRTWSEPTKS
ncbi:hypothetical protein BJY04DRAFT_149290 [Aspergillus karnatakaensis]|uniref:uncharacterized protein n=1 Tax=Aspergillus karnatakaensis TaxID=1810916 RepID=UPI003CCD9EC4